MFSVHVNHVQRFHEGAAAFVIVQISDSGVKLLIFCNLFVLSCIREHRIMLFIW